MKNKDLIAFPKHDNWNKFKYDARVLDAVASIFHLEGACAAVIKYGNNLYVSYNNQIANSNILIKEGIKQVNYFINNGSKDQLLSLYLLLNADFIKKQITHEDNNTFKEILKEFRSTHESLKPQLDVAITQKKLTINNIEKYQEINNSYYKLVEFIENTKRKETEITENLLRPLQDSYKIHHGVQKGYKFNDVKILDNKDGFHAEYNITLCVPIKYLDINYIGIAKLCCGFCHEYLDLHGYNHRGTHGVCDQKWKMYLSPFQEIFKNEVLANPIKITEGKEVFQHRRLSFDDFEEEIPLQLQNYTNLAELKAKLGLIYIAESATTQTAITCITEYTTSFNMPDILSNLNIIDLSGETTESSSREL